jgi:branched-chain amino acid transport system permease protein
MDWNVILENAIQASVSPEAIYLCLAAVGLNVQFGYTGLINFGQAAFLAVGSYSVAAGILTWGLSMWTSILVGIAASVLLALLLGIPTLRLRADYLAIVTIAAAEIVRILAGSVRLQEWFGGPFGLNGFKDAYNDLNPYEDSVGWGWFTFRPDTAWTMTVGWTLVAIFSLLVFLLMRSPWGRVQRAIREDEDAVRSLGKNVYSYKMQSLIIGGVIGTFGGFVLALNQGSVVPSDYTTETTFVAFTMLILGGAARVFGPVLGAVLFWGLLSLMDGILADLTAGADPTLPEWLIAADEASAFRFILVGLTLMLLMIFRPQGILGDRKEIALDAR